MERLVRVAYQHMVTQLKLGKSYFDAVIEKMLSGMSRK